MTLVGFAQNPNKNWEKVVNPTCIGWDTTEISKNYKNSGASTLMVLENGKVVISYGNISRRFKCHSIRKSLLNCIYGTYVKDSTIDINMKLSQIPISDFQRLTETEKTARIKDLLTSKSGVYIPAELETQYMKDQRPQRGSHSPGTFWYYNNWDYNVLGSILNTLTDKDLFESFMERIAIPLQMEEFRRMDGTYDFEDSLSVYPGYPFKMSARDLARIGQLYLQAGKWNNKQVISQDWITESTTYHHKFNPENNIYYGTGYGYLFWIKENYDGSTSYYADGYGGQYVGVYPSRNLVIVILANTYDGERVKNRKILIESILKAKKQQTNSNYEMDILNPINQIDNKKIKLSNQEKQKFVGEYKIDGNQFSIALIRDDLILTNYHYYYKFKLIPITKNEFFIEDIEKRLRFIIKRNNELVPLIE